MNIRTAGWVLSILGLAFSPGAQAAFADFSDVFIFGDSLSDPGNNAVLLPALPPPFGPLYGTTPVPIKDNSFIPVKPYASGHYTNDKVWAETFASALGLSANPVLRLPLGEGTNFAFGGARTGPEDPAFPDQLSTFPPTLSTQVAAFRALYEDSAPTDALYVVAGGGNNARDALDAIAMGADFLTTIGLTAQQYATDIGRIVDDLQDAGAQDIVVWNTPNAGVAPAVRTNGPDASFLATLLTSTMNDALRQRLDHDDYSEVLQFDLFGLVTGITLDPAAYGLTNVTDACAQFAACDPSKYLFWDGIHPTSAGHARIAGAMLAAVPEPSTWVMLVFGLVVLVGVVRRTTR